MNVPSSEKSERLEISPGRGLRSGGLVFSTILVCLVALSWLQMMVVHEAGHVIAAWATGGRVSEVELHPLAISRTDVEPNPHPRLVAWGGFVGGCGLPLLLWLAVRRLAPLLGSVARFFAGFCLVANGAYLAGGAVANVGDSRVLLGHGESAAVQVLVGLGLAASGLALWHGQGRHFSRAELSRRPKLALGLATALGLAILVQSWWG